MPLLSEYINFPSQFNNFPSQNKNPYQLHNISFLSNFLTNQPYIRTKFFRYPITLKLLFVNIHLKNPISYSCSPTLI